MGIHHVNKNGVNAYTSIQAAIDKALPGDEILIDDGIYEEKIELRKSGLTLIGEDPKRCIIRWQDYALKAHKDGNSYGTFRSYTCLVQGDDVTFENISIINAAGDGREVGQAVALYADGDRLCFRNCHLIGYQDTLFTAPLPEAPRIPGSFIGPSENRTYRNQKQYYTHCRIIGDVDYIFGSALAVFNECTMVSRDRGLEVNGYVTAPSTWKEAPYGYVFLNCDFVGGATIREGSVFLGRPWRAYGQVKLVGCRMDSSIHEERWDSWGNPDNFKTAVFEISATSSLDFLDVWHRDQLNNKVAFEGK